MPNSIENAGSHARHHDVKCDSHETCRETDTQIQPVESKSAPPRTAALRRKTGRARGILLHYAIGRESIPLTGPFPSQIETLTACEKLIIRWQKMGYNMARWPTRGGIPSSSSTIGVPVGEGARN